MYSSDNDEEINNENYYTDDNVVAVYCSSDHSYWQYVTIITYHDFL